MTQYSKGGYIPAPTPESVVLHPDECVIRMTRSPGLLCCRADHPTPTSDCTKHTSGLHHESENPA